MGPSMFGGLTEREFRSFHENIEERTVKCENSMTDELPCTNDCNYLKAPADLDAGEFRDKIFGRNCSAYLDHYGIVWATCYECVAREEKYRRKQKEIAEAQARPRIEAERKRAKDAELADYNSLSYWMRLNDLEFEQSCAGLFKRLGYIAKTTQRSNDGAFDVLLEKDGMRGGIQCKAWSNPCGVKVLREFYGALHTEKMTFGFFVAKSGFTPSASDLLVRMPELKGICVNGLLKLAAKIGDSAA